MLATGNIRAQTPQPELLCSGKHDNAPVFLTRDANGVVERLEIESTKDGSYRGRYVAMPDDLLAELCRRGISLATMPKPDVRSESGKRQKAGIEQKPYLPTDFRIEGIYIPSYLNIVVGNFWVPGWMPASDNAHLAQYTVVDSNFGTNAYPDNSRHFVNALTAWSNDDFSTGFKGKGVIFGANCGRCFAPVGTTFPYAAVSQTWLLGGPNECAGISCAVFNGGTVPPNIGPATGVVLANNTSYDYLIGANRLQESVYFLKPSSSNTWQTTPFTYSSEPSYNTFPYQPHQAGIAFFVASGLPHPTGKWSLTFSGVSAWTQP